MEEYDIDFLFKNLGVERVQPNVHNERVYLELIFRLNQKVNELKSDIEHLEYKNRCREE
jgi:hypothetical protein